MKTIVRRNSWWVHKWTKFKRWQDAVKDREISTKEKEMTRLKMANGLYLTAERPEDALPKKDRADMTRKDTGAMPMDLLTNHTQMRYIDHSIDNIRRFERYEHFTHLQYDQRMIPERLLFLGPDLAAAHFLVHRGAAVKFLGDDVWYKRDKKGGYSLPGRKVDDLFIEAIDASNTELMFEGFENLANLNHLRLLRVTNCEYMTDWVISRISSLLPTLTMLDLSGCHRLTAKGLMGLKTLKDLKYLRLEGLDHIRDLGKATLVLEECIPNLKVLGVNLEKELDLLVNETILLSNERVLLDARDNAFVEDDDGRLFYVRGNVNERPAVCDDDLPIVTSTVRREIPNMPDEQFDQLDRLSGGKLRHLLVGSPSGYEWNEQVETILQHEAKLKLKDKEWIDPKMLPSSQRQSLNKQIEDEAQHRKELLLGTAGQMK